MTNAICKRFWEGTVGIVIRPQKKRNGDYFWTFSFVRAFRRDRNAQWEYVQHYGQQHAKAVGLVMTKAFQFMDQTDPVQFIETAMTKAGNAATKQEQHQALSLDGAKLPPHSRVAA